MAESFQAGGPAAVGAATSSAPKVAQPKKLKGVDACQLLNANQLQTLGATATPTTGQSVWGEKSCEWSNERLSRSSWNFGGGPVIVKLR